MRIPSPLKLLPQPHQVLDLTKRVAGLLPGRPGHASEEVVAAPPPPTPIPAPPPTPLKPKAKPRPKAKAVAKPKAAPAPKAKAKPKAKAAAKAKTAKTKPKPRKPGPHHALNVPVGEPDPTEWPDPYDRREDPRDPPDPDGKPFGEDPHPVTGGRSTSEPHPSEDPGVEELREKYARDKLDQ